MTITIKRSTAAVLLCLVGILGGLAIGQVADAFSSGGEATASGSAGFEKTLKKTNKTVSEMNTTLKAMNETLGLGYDFNSIHLEVQKIKKSTLGVCTAVGAIGCGF